MVGGQSNVVSGYLPLALLWDFSSIGYLPDDDLAAEGFLELNVKDGRHHVLTRSPCISSKLRNEAPGIIHGGPLQLIRKKMLCRSLYGSIGARSSRSRRSADTGPSTFDNSTASEASIPPSLISNIGNGEAAFQGR